MSLRYCQIGRVIDVHAPSGHSGDLLARELSLYPSASPGAPEDVTVRFGPSPSAGIRARNPSLHIEQDCGFTAHGVMASSTYAFQDNRLREIQVDIHAAPGRLGRLRRRLFDSQYTDRMERIGVLFHEAALVPAAAFDPERAPIHASGIQALHGGVTLFGGTGGVGKTSLELYLGRHTGYRFLADDVAVLDADGWVYPNLAYPKIYGYNAPPNSDLRRILATDRTLLDRAHWAVHSTRGADKVRRRVPPSDLFSGVSQDGGTLERYVVLARENRDELVVEPLSPARAAEISAAVMAAELSELMRHLHWHVVNRAILSQAPWLRPDALHQRWEELYRQAFSGAECLIARIPTHIEHDTFLARMHTELAL